ncbi:helical backbone metal receptor [Nocardioides sp.]|uniref:helical backbone metal receptor n=1 Tax=Nocardioides sp. TaxID=35761 RepID=UPI0035146E10
MPPTAAPDDLGHPVALPTRVTRVVSLVPSLTEALASIDADAVVGATDWCTHPPDLAATRVRGTKNPDLASIRALAPEVVVCTKEENRELDVRRLRESGVAVWVTDHDTVPDAVASMERLVDALGWARPDWLAQARADWCGPLPAVTHRVVLPIWRDPWMVVGGTTFTGDLLRRLGWENLGATLGDRYPGTDPAGIAALSPDVVLLPDEPYVFTADDGPEALDGLPTVGLSGRLLTWYGPSLAEVAAWRGRDPRECGPTWS